MAQIVEFLVKSGVTPPHPGAFFVRRFLEPRNISRADAAERIGITEEKLYTFAEGQINVDEALAEKLASFTHTSSKFWLNMQAVRDSFDDRM